MINFLKVELDNVRILIILSLDKLTQARTTIKDLFNRFIILYREFKSVISFLFFVIKIVILNKVFFR